MRIAILSDIHGNPRALDAILQDVGRQGEVDGYWVLGDLCALGYDPAGVLDRLAQFKNAHFIRGNADRYVSTGARPSPSIAEIEADHSLIPLFAEVASSFAWTQGYIAGRGWSQWLAELPIEARLTLPDGTRVLLVHAEPGLDDSHGLHPGLPDHELLHRIANCEADLICVGHFHKAMDRTLDGVRIINPGCISNPSSGTDLRPTYAILEANTAHHSIDFYRVNYDYTSDIEAVKRCGIAGVEFLTRALTGSLHIGWMDKWDGRSYTPMFHATKASMPQSVKTTR